MISILLLVSRSLVSALRSADVLFIDTLAQAIRHVNSLRSQKRRHTRMALQTEPGLARARAVEALPGCPSVLRGDFYST